MTPVCWAGCRSLSRIALLSQHSRKGPQCNIPGDVPEPAAVFREERHGRQRSRRCYLLGGHARDSTFWYARIRENLIRHRAVASNDAVGPCGQTLARDPGCTAALVTAVLQQRFESLTSREQE